MDYRFGDMLGDTFMFYEAQHSGNITEIPGGSRHGWRGPQMLQDGSDVDMDLTGGLYEAGSALPAHPSFVACCSSMHWSLPGYSLPIRDAATLPGLLPQLCIHTNMPAVTAIRTPTNAI